MYHIIDSINLAHDKTSVKKYRTALIAVWVTNVIVFASFWVWRYSSYYCFPGLFYYYFWFYQVLFPPISLSILACCKSDTTVIENANTNEKQVLIVGHDSDNCYGCECCVWGKSWNNCGPCCHACEHHCSCFNGCCDDCSVCCNGYDQCCNDCAKKCCSCDCNKCCFVKDECCAGYGIRNWSITNLSMNILALSAGLMGMFSYHSVHCRAEDWVVGFLCFMAWGITVLNLILLVWNPNPNRPH